MNESEKTPDFDADYLPDNEVNQEAAIARNVTYDHESGCYVDADGCLIYDEFGQPL